MEPARDGVTRRALLGAAIGGAGVVLAGRGTAVATPTRTAPRPDAGAMRRVVVIGAGLSGMTAALELVGAGWDVVVLEARQRVGGRVHTLYEPFGAGLHAESGGESIDDGHKAMLAMIKRFGLRTEHRAPLKPYDATVYYQGQRLPLAELLARRNGQVLRDVLRFYDAAAVLGNGIDPEHPEKAPNAHSLDARNVGGFLAGQQLAPEAEFLMRAQIRGEYNAEPGDISLLFFAQQEAASPGGTLSLLTAETRRITGGNSRLPQAMAAALGHRIRLGAEVTRVTHSNHDVRVHTGATHVDAAWLVVSTPMMPLRRVHFDPVLPGSVRAMISGLDLGAAVKVIREYAVPFWTAEGFSGFTITDLPFALGWSPTDSYTAAHGLLSEFITGDAARAAAALAPPKRMTWAQAQLNRVYPEGKALLTNHAATMAWANERFTGGGYAVYRPGQLAPFYPVLRDGIGRIRFAGEHASGLAGYMESAVRSGHRAARQIGAVARRQPH